jgi:hypothetical protein
VKINVVEEVAEGRAHVSWATVKSQHKGKTLVIWVFRDAMKFDGVPALTWDWKTPTRTDAWYTDEVFNGVRLPATALELQKIADITGCMLLTPKVIDLIWLQAGLKFDPVTNTQPYPGASPKAQRRIVANSHIHRVHVEIERKIDGRDDGQVLIASVGKYWCLINQLANPTVLIYGADNACNYGWPSSGGRYNGVTPGIKVWQPTGFKHDHHHWDPSQTIRLMYCKALLIHEDGHQEWVDLRTLAGSEHAGLLHHEAGELVYLRQAGVPAPLEDVAMPMYAPDFSLVA